MAQGLGPNGEDLFVDSEGNKWGTILIFGEGDMEQLVVVWGCKHYQSTHEMCAWCLANRSTHPYTDLSPEATWRPTENMTNAVRTTCRKCMGFHSVSSLFTEMEIKP